MVKVNTNKAFSLLEMSITLTIISLIIAAVLSGQNIKHRLELNQVVTGISTITSAYKQFKDIYSNSLPGDYFSAETMFGSANTDNGNGNSYLETSITAGNNGCSNEELLFWQHLQLAGLITGSYDCVTTGAGGLMSVTQMKYGYYLAHKASGGRLYIQVSKSDGSGLFTTKEASDYDTKYDNGTPTITSSTSLSAADGTGETAGNCVSSAAYNTSNLTGTPCILYFYLE